MKRDIGFWQLVESAVAACFWLQATRVLMSALFGVIYDALFGGGLSMAVVGVVALAVVAAFLAPSAASIKGIASSGRLWALVAMLAAAVARAPLTVNHPSLRLAGSIVVVAAAGVYLGLLVVRQPALLPVALAIGLLVDQAARAYGDTWDITIQPGFLPIQIVICLATIALAWTVYSREPGAAEPDMLAADRARPTGALRLGGGLGLGSFLFLQTSVLSQPHVLARWTGVAYELVAPALFLITALALMLLLRRQMDLSEGPLMRRLRSWGVAARGGLLLIGGLVSLALGLVWTGPAGLVALLVAQLLALLSLPLAVWPVSTGDRRAGRALGLGTALFFVLQLAFAFAFTYPYTIAAFRDAGAWIILIAAVAALAPAGLRPPEAVSGRATPPSYRLALTVLVGLAIVLVWARPEPLRQRQPTESLRVATYNMHYGYDTVWHHALEEQAQTIEASGADVVLLQEVDAGRITSYGVDNALWLGRRLGMEQVFAPTLEGLSGVALLSRLPVSASHWVLLPSELEQTALVQATLALDGSTLEAYGVWLGLEDRERINQVTAALAAIGAASPAVLGGDLNSEPDSAVYAAIEAAGFEDPFVVLGELPGFTDPAVDPRVRIDYVWVRGLVPIAADVLPSLASDHRLVVVELALP